MSRQKTIRKPVTISGHGLFSGQASTLRFVPAPPNTGIVFARMDLPRPVKISATIANLSPQQDRRTSLRDGTTAVSTTEHVLSAINGLGIDNILLELTAEEVPNTDASPLPYAEALTEAGIEEQAADKRVFVIDAPLVASQGTATLAALPGEEDWLDILFDLDYGQIKSIGRQIFGFRLYADNYLAKIAPARTFLLQEETAHFQAMGWGKHLSASDLLVMGPDGPVDNELRFPDEHVRHKIADLIGDLALLGRTIRGRIVAHKSGHALNHQLVRGLAERAMAREHGQSVLRQPTLDIRHLLRLLPHRYPFLMIDRVLEMEGDTRAVAIKNVTINEPFFQGHYPGEPIMPGVLILEAMAQLSGVLLSQRLEHTGKVAVLLSLDRAKMRRPVRPGDQLVLEAVAVHVRSRTGHCRCRALVAGELVAEAEIKFMLVDSEAT